MIFINEFSKCKFNIRKQKGHVWKELDYVKGSDRKCSGRGSKKRYYEWDNTHNDIEMYDSKGGHLGSLDLITGDIYKDKVLGRRIKI